MRFRSLFNIWAVFVLAAGIALFLSSCGPQQPFQKKKVQGPFDQGEIYFQKGNYAEAKREFNLYLEKFPKGKKLGRALHRLATIDIIEGRPEEALNTLTRVLQEYRDQVDVPLARYHLIIAYHQLKNTEQSNTEALTWLEDYPKHPLRGDLFSVIGKNDLAVGNRAGAFQNWILSEEAYLQAPQKRERISEQIKKLIDESSLEDLETLITPSVDTPYQPRVYFRLADRYLEDNRIQKAREMATLCMQSTQEEAWITAGQNLLDRIDTLLSVEARKIGCLLPLSGPFAIYGQEVLRGIELGLGIGQGSDAAQDVELVIRDTAGDPERAVAGLEDLVNTENVMALIGPLVSKTSMTAAKRAQELGTPIITLTQKEGITAEGDLIFRNFLTPSLEIDSILDKAFNEAGLKRFALLYPENPYGLFFMNLFWDKVLEYGGEITAVESYPLDETDFAEQIKKMVGLYYPRTKATLRKVREMMALEAEERIRFSPDPDDEPYPIVDFDAVFIPDVHQRVAMIIPQFPFYNIFDVRFLGTRLWQSQELIDMAGDYLRHAFFPSGFFEQHESEITQNFVALYRDSFESDPGILAAHGYDTIRLLKAIFGDVTIRTRRDLAKSLLEFEGIEGVTGTLSFDEQGEVQKSPLLLTVSGKKFKVLP